MQKINEKEKIRLHNNRSLILRACSFPLGTLKICWIAKSYKTLYSKKNMVQKMKETGRM
jgi:hypothetical protein